MKSLPFRKLVDVAGKPGDPEHSAWLHILRDKKISLKKQWHGYGTTAEFQRILVRQDDLCLAQTIASAVRHIGGVIEFRKQQALIRAATPCKHVWDGPRISVSEACTMATCSKCGQSAEPELLQRAETPVQPEAHESPNLNPKAE